MGGIENPDSFQTLFLNLDRHCLTNECECDFNPHNSLEQCHQADRGCDWVKTKNTTMTGKVCQKWILPPEEYIQIPSVDILSYVVNNNVEGNHCMNMDQDILGPWCYTTDPNTHFEYCGICEVRDIEETIEFGHYNDSWIPIIENRWLHGKSNPNLTDLEILRKELRDFENLRSAGFILHNFRYGNEMSRRMIDLTSPGGQIKNSTLEPYGLCYKNILCLDSVNEYLNLDLIVKII